MKNITNNSLLGVANHSANESILAPGVSSPGLMRTLKTKGMGKALKILTLDLETRRLVSGQLEVISSAIYDGKITLLITLLIILIPI